MIFKNTKLSIPILDNETNEEHTCRSWFVAKNIHLVEHGEMNMNTLIGYSHIHLKIELFNHQFNTDVMKTYKLLKKNLYCI